MGWNHSVCAFLVLVSDWGTGKAQTGAGVGTVQGQWQSRMDQGRFAVRDTAQGRTQRHFQVLAFTKQHQWKTAPGKNTEKR